jgi:hypothetical protein
MTDKTLGHYRIAEKLRTGGMGAVYLAQDTRLRRKVAFMVLPTEFNGRHGAPETVVQEAKAASRLNHEP